MVTAKRQRYLLYDFGELKFSKPQFPEDDDNIYPMCSRGTLNEMMVVVAAVFESGRGWWSGSWIANLKFSITCWLVFFFF